MPQGKKKNEENRGREQREKGRDNVRHMGEQGDVARPHIAITLASNV